MNKICHITTLHPRMDTRIFHKECVSLSKYYDVNLIVADGKGDEVVKGVHIYDIGERYSSRVQRVLFDTQKMFKKAVELDCCVYHIHDPELISIGLKLKKLKKKIVYDVHEDLPRQIYGKTYLKEWLKPFVSRVVEKRENRVAKKYDYICTATSYIRDRFLNINNKTVDVNNYPIVTELLGSVDWIDKRDEVCYIGGLSEVRGTREIVKAFEYIDGVKLILAGNFFDDNLKIELEKLTSWGKVDFKGYLDRQGVYDILLKSKVGLVILHPLINYLNALPVKMFEYMLSGIPVIASDIPLWRRIVDECECGMVVNPFDTKAIAKAIKYLIDNPKDAEKMGKMGQKAILDKYNWSNEEQKLVSMYDYLLN
jgi:glycosyltransferase involved in cell wall biosynthesis